MVKLKQKITFFQRLVIAFPFVALLLLQFRFKQNYAVFLLLIPFFFVNYFIVFTNNKQCYYQVDFLNFKLFRVKRKFIKPYYISLFQQRYKHARTFGFFPDIFGVDDYSMVTIKFFSDNDRETIYKTNNKEEALEKATCLSKIFDVEIYNTIN